jgi:ectoine hydroxylase-related dioxygenase (phytanoyl-CoA dioxygenase family)
VYNGAIKRKTPDNSRKSKEISVRPTEAEITEGQLTDENLRLALRMLRDAGYVVIEGVLDQAFLSELRAAYDEALEQHIAARGGLEGINKKSFGRNHIGLHLPLIMPFADPRIVANPIGVQVMAAALGDDLTCSFYHSNTAYPGSGTQNVHRDYPPIFRTELQVPTPVTHVVFNVPLCDFTEENGSTEVWPGTHLIVDTDPEDGKMEQLEERVEYLPSQRTNMPAGSIVVRDLRMWHRGKPNNSNEVRTMLALIYQRGWTASHKLVKIPRETWDAWPERARRIFRDNPIVDEVESAAHATA